MQPPLLFWRELGSQTNKKRKKRKIKKKKDKKNGFLSKTHWSFIVITYQQKKKEALLK